MRMEDAKEVKINFDVKKFFPQKYSKRPEPSLYSKHSKNLKVYIYFFI